MDFCVKVRQPVGRKDSIQTVCEEAGGMYFCMIAAQNFEVFSNIQDQNLKIKNLKRLMSFSRPIHDGTTVMQIESGHDGTVNVWSYCTYSILKVRYSDQNFRLARLPCHNSFHLEQVSIQNVGI